MSEVSNPLYPMTVEELATEIDQCMSVMFARKEIGYQSKVPNVAKRLAEKMWLRNVRPMRAPGLKTSLAEDYPGNPKHQRPEQSNG